MSNEYHVHGIELSPYSVKVRSYFRYKGIPHRWIPRSLDAEGEYQKFAKLPLVPLVVTPNNEGIQDSTPIIEFVEARHPEPSIHPADPATRFISALLEEFGDEWGNKWMFHYRWAREADILSAAGRIARSMMPAVDEAQLANGIAMVRERMVPRVSFVGSNPQTAPQIEESFRDTLTILEPHFANRLYLFGGRPAFADFALWGQLYNAWTDPTPGAIINATTPNLLAWIHRMLWPRAEGDFESVVESRAQLDAVARAPGRQTLHAVDSRQCRSDREGRRRLQRRTGRTQMDPEAAEVPRKIARSAARKVSGGRRQARSRYDPRRVGLPGRVTAS